MRIETFGKDVEVTPALKEYVETKLARAGRHFVGEHCETRVTLKLEKNKHHVEATSNIPGNALHAEASGQSMYEAIDILADKLDRQLTTEKEKKQQKKQQHVPLPLGDNED